MSYRVHALPYGYFAFYGPEDAEEYYGAPLPPPEEGAMLFEGLNWMQARCHANRLNKGMENLLRIRHWPEGEKGQWSVVFRPGQQAPYGVVLDEGALRPLVSGLTSREAHKIARRYNDNLAPYRLSPLMPSLRPKLWSHRRWIIR